MEGPRTAGYHRHHFKIKDEMKHHHVFWKGQDALLDPMFSLWPNYNELMPAPLLCLCSSIYYTLAFFSMEAIRRYYEGVFMSFLLFIRQRRETGIQE